MRIDSLPRRFACAAALVALCGAAAHAQNGSPISDALMDSAEDVRAYDMHISTLANPFMGGRVPGTEGSELAKRYIEFHFEKYGLEPAFPDEDGNAFSTYRDPFPLRGTWEVQSESLMAMNGNRRIEFDAEKDFMFTGMGSTGEARGEAVFVGYSIDNGPDGYSSYAEGDSLEGKIAVLFRFEPMDENGRSLWNDGERGWSPRAAFANKLRAASERGAEGIIIINTPGANDARAEQLARFAGGADADAPVSMMSPKAAERMLKAAGFDGSLMDLREHADEGHGLKDLGFEIALGGEADRTQLIAENIGGVIRGVGDLADEWIVVGAHLDHLGMGYFGSRTGDAGTLHPGADDNASGTAGVILIADKLSQRFADDATPRRSILLVGFDAEESGLNGARHYVVDPIAPIDDHMLMVNWDMIGRIENERVLVAGGFSADGLGEFIQPHVDASGLEAVIPDRFSGGSDHLPFYRAEVPVLFSIIADFHSDYHTPADTVDKINRVGAVKTVRMYENIVADAAVRPGKFRFITASEQRERQQQREREAAGERRVRVGVVLDADDNESGVLLAEVTENGPAAKAGLRSGDRLVRWDGQKILDTGTLGELVARHSPGDTVNVGVMRDGEEVTLTVTLEGR
ncbi:MAG: M28 family peptidase [Planctomycetota bacterium]